ncbi:MAG: DNA-directed RNA polymerase subunit A'' [Candidatus Aenigmarchaeota archaeon]|nr:DNA-directed RNA polymerase subunit A'' [Candidatus Aenigmarchaeota archaeon]
MGEVETLEQLKELLPEKLFEKSKEALKKSDLTEGQKKKAIIKIADLYVKSKFEAGEAFGVIAAQSLSEPSTQMTMRTYHMAGAMQIQVTLGLPRLVEIFDARRAPSTPAMTIYLKPSYNTREKAMEIAESITEVKLGNIATSSFVDLGNMQVEVVLDEKLMRKHKIKEEEMVEQLKLDFKNYVLHQRGNKVTIKPKDDATVKELQKLRSKFLDSHVHGVKSIENVVINQKDEGWIINTLGSNLAKILELDGIDSARTLTNNIHEVAKVLGIEAARASIVNEVLLTLKEQGLEDVDVRHVLLVADVMTAGGTIKAVGRYGIAGTKGSVLARANFEETMKHLTKASVYNEIDTLESIVENVMINQVVPAGTGMFDIVFKPPLKKKE